MIWYARPRLRFWIVAFAMLALAFPIQIAHAVQPDEVLADGVLEARARSISHGLRCLVCQNQSIDDSDAPLARDLRLLVRERLVAGESDAQVMEFVVARFGDFVLLKPPFKGSTVLLWIAPLLILGGGTLLIVRQFKSQKAQGAAAALSPEEERVLADLMQTTEPAASDGLDTAR